LYYEQYFTKIIRLACYQIGILNGEKKGFYRLQRSIVEVEGNLRAQINIRKYILNLGYLSNSFDQDIALIFMKSIIVSTFHDGMIYIFFSQYERELHWLNSLYFKPNNY